MRINLTKIKKIIPRFGEMRFHDFNVYPSTYIYSKAQRIKWHSIQNLIIKPRRNT